MRAAPTYERSSRDARFTRFGAGRSRLYLVRIAQDELVELALGIQKPNKHPSARRGFKLFKVLVDQREHLFCWEVGLLRLGPADKVLAEARPD